MAGAIRGMPATVDGHAHLDVCSGSKLPVSAAPYSRPVSGVELKELTRNPTFRLRHPELRVLLPWLAPAPNSRS